MPLIRSVLVTEIRKINDKDFAQFAGFPEDTAAVARRWVALARAYAGPVVPPSITGNAAQTAFENTMLANLSGGNGLQALAISFQQFATVLAIGQSPAFTGVPPTTPLVLTSIAPIGLAGGDGAAERVANALADLIHAWFRTGRAFPRPSGPPVNWA